MAIDEEKDQIVSIDGLSTEEIPGFAVIHR